MSNNEHLLDALKDINTLRDQAIKKYEDNKQNLYNKVPALLEIENEIAKETYNTIKVATNRTTNSSELIYRLKEKIQVLKDSRDKILAREELNFNYFEPDFTCKKCSDTGYLHSKKCDCLNGRLLNRRYHDSNLVALLDKQNFDTFNLNLYSDFSNDGKSPRYYANLNLTYCKNYCNNFGKNYENLLIRGKAGLGKTFLCSCIAKAVMDRGFSVIYETYYNLLLKYNDIRFGKSTDSIDDYINCDLLIIDDLGSENRSDYNTSVLFHILNDRIVRNKPIVISTNFDYEDIRREYGDRITSRLSSKDFVRLPFIGNDMRTYA